MKDLPDHQNVLRDQRVKVEESSKIVDMSVERPHHIFHVKLGMSKLCGRWVLCVLNADIKRERVRIYTANLKVVNINPVDFFVDESWLHYTSDIAAIHRQSLER